MTPWTHLATSKSTNASVIKSLTDSDLSTGEAALIVIIGLITAVFIGTVFFELGSRLESGSFDVRRRRSHSYFEECWDAYIGLELPKREHVAQGYIVYLVRRMRVNLTMVAALLCFSLGAAIEPIVHDRHAWTNHGAWQIASVVAMLLATMMWFHAWRIHGRLDRTRRLLLNACGVYDPAGKPWQLH